MKKRPLLVKLVTTYSLLTFGVITILLTVLFTGQIGTINENNLSRLKLDIYTATDFAKSAANRASLLQSIPQEMVGLGFDHYALYAERGVQPLLVGNDITLPGSEDFELVSSSIARLALSGDTLTYLITGKKIFTFNPFVDASGSVYVLKIVGDFRDSEKKIDGLLTLGSILGFFVIGLHIIFAVYVYRILFKRIQKIADASVQLSAGNYSMRVYDSHDDELGAVLNVFNTMTSKLEEAVQEAFNANALTHLPGNHEITTEINRRLASGSKFSILYTDLDNFKAYNDRYGAHAGDEAIFFSKKALEATRDWFPNHYIFLGHEGGDDFVVIADYEISDAFCRRLCYYFDYYIRHGVELVPGEGIKTFYTPEDIERGFIDGVDRQGNKATFGLVSISVAFVSNNFKKISHASELIEWSAQIKKKVKTDPAKKGSSYMEDRRRADEIKE